jgi:RNase H-fold protein (predicted Holliday junction resolvase)
MKVFWLDIGEKRIGIAVSDALRGIAQGARYGKEFPFSGQTIRESSFCIKPGSTY